MALTSVALHLTERSLGERERAFIEDGLQRIDRFELERARPLPAFVPSDFPLAAQALREISERKLAPGSTFCEWGCGFGVVTALAALQGFRAFGIEIEADLIAEARRLSNDHNIKATFTVGSFIPEGGEPLCDAMGELSWLDAGGADGYDLLAMEPDEFDLFYAFPWPGEEHVVLDLFEEFAATGALLLVYLGEEGMQLYRKSPRGRH